MERGIPNITVYSFAAAPGRSLNYPDAELWTLDENEARAYAEKNGYQLIGSDCKPDEEELIEDFTPRPRFEFVNSEGADSTEDDDREEDACRVFAYMPTLVAEVLYDEGAGVQLGDNEGAWCIFLPLGSPGGYYPTWRDAMQAAGVTDFRELDG